VDPDAHQNHHGLVLAHNHVGQEGGSARASSAVVGLCSQWSGSSKSPRHDRNIMLLDIYLFLIKSKKETKKYILIPCKQEFSLLEKMFGPNTRAMNQ